MSYVLHKFKDGTNQA